MAERGKGEGGEGFLSRWSRRKEAARKAAAPSPAPTAEPFLDPAAEPSPGPPAEPEIDPAAEPEIDPASLPRIEELTAESDLSVFLRRGVPAALRTAALRRAWSLDPAIRDHVGLAEYAWDWNTPGGAPGYVADIASGADVEALADRLLGPAPGQREEGGAREAPAPVASPEPEGAAPKEGAAGPAAVRLTVPEAADRASEGRQEREPGREGEVGAECEPGREAGRKAGHMAGRRRHGGAVPI